MQKKTTLFYLQLIIFIMFFCNMLKKPKYEQKIEQKKELIHYYKTEENKIEQTIRAKNKTIIMIKENQLRILKDTVRIKKAIWAILYRIKYVNKYPE